LQYVYLNTEQRKLKQCREIRLISEKVLLFTELITFILKSIINQSLIIKFISLIKHFAHIYIYIESRKFVVRFRFYWRPPEGFYFHWRGLKKCFLQFKTLRRVIYIPLEGFSYLSRGVIIPLEGFRNPSWGFIIPLEGFKYPFWGYIIPLEGFRYLS